MRLLLVISYTALFFCFQFNNGLANEDNHFQNIITIESDSAAVLSILEHKCNVCHQQKNKVIFTNDNLPFYYLAIEEQVFIKKRMPKGRKIKLTESEKLVITNWIQSMKN